MRASQFVELSPLCGGGSTKNAGFACFGSPSELLDDWNTLGPEKTIELVASRYNGLKILGQIILKKIGYEPTGAIELFTDEVCELKEKTLEFLPTINEALEEVFGSKPSEVKSYKNGVSDANAVISSPMEGILDTSKLYSEQLSARRLPLGIDIITDVQIKT